jgi:hypothetical protein
MIRGLQQHSLLPCEKFGLAASPHLGFESTVTRGRFGMTSSRRVQIGNPVNCSDGPCGTVTRILVDPSLSSITHLAVGSHRSGGRLVPFAYVTSTVPGVELKCTKAEFDAFLSDRDQALVSDVADTFADVTPPPRSLGVTLMIDAGLIAPVGIAGPPRPKPQPEPITFDRVPAGEEELKPDEQVKAKDGPIGRVSGIAIDPATDRITHLLAEARHLSGKREIAIPIGDVDHIGVAVNVGLTKQQIHDLEQI